jgi:ubiquinone/menaquinone biosynthesis C-methylase UbiE
MSLPEQSSPLKSDYIFNAESATEMARLMLQDRLVNKMVGGLFPERENLDGINSILDIGCGPGGWTLDVARSYPKKEITGIDISDTMLTYAKEQKKLHELKNIHFKKMDVRQKLAFPNQSFDLINIRAATGYITRRTWPLLLQECARITRPGGVLRVSETDRIGLTNSLPFEKYAHYFTHLLAKLEYGFAVDTYTFGMSPMLGKVFQDAGYGDMHMKSYVLDFSYGTAFHPIQLQNIEISFQLLQPRLIEMGIAAQEELESTYEAVIQDLRSETFCGLCYLFTLWGKYDNVLDK